MVRIGDKDVLIDLLDDAEQYILCLNKISQDHKNDGVGSLFEFECFVKC